MGQRLSTINQSSADNWLQQIDRQFPEKLRFTAFISTAAVVRQLSLTFLPTDMAVLLKFEGGL